MSVKPSPSSRKKLFCASVSLQVDGEVGDLRVALQRWIPCRGLQAEPGKLGQLGAAKASAKRFGFEAWATRVR